MINNDDNHILRFHDITVNLLQLRVWHGPKEIHFTLAELRLLLAFLSDPYKTFTRDELINQADLTSVSYLQGVGSSIFRDYPGVGMKTRMNMSATRKMETTTDHG